MFGFGTLLGPEKTSALWVFFLAAPGLDCLTRPVVAFRGECVGVVVVVVGWGVVVC
jgi:hypothetical protein